jgi:hypothetical protein
MYEAFLFSFGFLASASTCDSEPTRFRLQQSV